VAFRPPVERWRGTAAAVSPPGLPVDLVLAEIELESGGKPGICSSANACGLMQVKPSVVLQYNASHKPIPFDRMRGTTPEAAADQIRIGAWLLDHHLRIMNKREPARAPYPAGPVTDWQARAADLRYSHGGGAFDRLRAAARTAGFPDDFDGWREYQQTHNPSWTSENPFFHAFAAWELAQAAGGTRRDMLARYGGTSPGKPSRVTARAGTGGAGFLALLALAIAAARKA